MLKAGSQTGVAFTDGDDGVGEDPGFSFEQKWLSHFNNDRVSIAEKKKSDSNAEDNCNNPVSIF